ncbi:MAG: DNA-processing protein DprA [Trueperaceae bacterium]
MVGAQFTVQDLVGELNQLERKHAPPAVFIAGRPGLLKRRPRISIVGTRDPSRTGEDLAEAVATAVVDSGGVVVSGLAKGIDTIALRTAIEKKGDAIAVIGTPLSKTYPAENAKLQAELMRRHLVVSQFAEGTPTGRHSFPIRNRTMALLSDATVIIEAGESSGTQHQGWEAIRLGRPLFIPTTLLAEGITWAASMLTYGAFTYSNAGELQAFFDERMPTTLDLPAVVERALALA